jgi:hypothetical protein
MISASLSSCRSVNGSSCPSIDGQELLLPWRQKVVVDFLEVEDGVVAAHHGITSRF